MHVCMRPPAQRRSMQALHVRRRLAACTRTAAKKSAITVRSSTTCTAPQRCCSATLLGLTHCQTRFLARHRSQVQGLSQTPANTVLGTAMQPGAKLATEGYSAQSSTWRTKWRPTACAR